MGQPLASPPQLRHLADPFASLILAAEPRQGAHDSLRQRDDAHGLSLSRQWAAAEPSLRIYSPGTDIHIPNWRILRLSLGNWGKTLWHTLTPHCSQAGAATMAAEVKDSGTKSRVEARQEISPDCG